LKSGAAYMPINPDYPKDRIDYMISDSDCKFILASEDIEYEKTDITKIIFPLSNIKRSANFNVTLLYYYHDLFRHLNHR
jgi:non-ribosomal peptide synthetase component F